MSDLDALRRELDEIDHALLDAARRRNAVVRRIAEAKAGAGDRPLFDRERERAVYERAERTAREIGLAPETAHRLVEVLVEASHAIQEWALREHAAATGTDAAQRILMVGGAGRMGRRLAADLAPRGHRIDVLEPGDPRDPGDVVSAADVVMIAVPMALAERVAGELAPFVRADALLCDINSLKGDICRVMAERCRGEVLGLHPMFGPTVHALRRQKVVVCPVREGDRARLLRRELAQMGLELIESDPETHDRMMAVVQVLTHFSTIVMGAALRTAGGTVEDGLRFTSPIYRLELAFVGRLFAQSADLYAEIEMSNPHADDVRRAFLDAARDAEAMLRAGDRRAFRDLFESVAHWFHGFQDEAMRLSDRIIDSMVRWP